MELYWLFAAATFVFGLAFGSFLNVCIYRLPRGISVSSPSRSFCPTCQTQIAAYDNIPVVSWILLGGKCRKCKQPISGRYALVEVLTGFFFLVSYLYFGGPTWAAAKAAAFSFLILGLIFTDLEMRLLPDAMTLPGFVIGLLFSLVVPVGGLLDRYALDSAYASWWQSPRVISVANSLLAALIGAGMVYLVAELYLRLRGMEGMGLGDVKLMLLIGAFLGIRGTVLVLFLASIAGAIFGAGILIAIYRKRMQRYKGRAGASKRAYQSASLAMRFVEMPFGVFLGGMALLTLFYGERIVTSYLHWYFSLVT